MAVLRSFSEIDGDTLSPEQASSSQSAATTENDSLGTAIYRDLRQRLAAGEYQPGQKISLRKLAGARGTSLMPVRDALRQLMVERGIELMPNRTFRVPVMSERRFRELRDIRIRLEGMAVEMAADRMAPADWKYASDLSDQFTTESEIANPDNAKLVQLNMRLHFTIYQGADSNELLRVIENLWIQVGPVMNFDVKNRLQPGSRRSPCEFHKRLIEALGRRDVRAAAESLAGDINNTYNYIIAQDVLDAS